MARRTAPTMQQLADPALQQFLREFIALEVIPADFWGSVTLHVQNGRLNHSSINQTFKPPKQDGPRVTEGSSHSTDIR